MESKVKLLGHSVHPMLIVFPLGLLISAAICDIITAITGWTGLASVSFWNIAGGVVMGAVAALIGIIDWFSLPNGTRAKRIGIAHGASGVLVLLLFMAAWLLRMSAPSYRASTAALIIECAAVAYIFVAGWLGGELVHRLGVGVDYGANLNAPSSLSGRPALPLQAKGGGQTKGGGQLRASGPARGGRVPGTGPRLVHSNRG